MSLYKKDSLSAQARGRRDTGTGMGVIYQSKLDGLYYIANISGDRADISYVTFDPSGMKDNEEYRGEISLESLQSKYTPVATYDVNTGRKDSMQAWNSGSTGMGGETIVTDFDKKLSNGMRVIVQSDSSTNYYYVLNPDGSTEIDGFTPKTDSQALGRRIALQYDLVGYDSARKDGLSAGSRTNGRRVDATTDYDIAYEQANEELGISRAEFEKRANENGYDYVKYYYQRAMGYDND